jgi:hypothetical protein
MFVPRNPLQIEQRPCAGIQPASATLAAGTPVDILQLLDVQVTLPAADGTTPARFLPFHQPRRALDPFDNTQSPLPYTNARPLNSSHPVRLAIACFLDCLPRAADVQRGQPWTVDAVLRGPIPSGHRVAISVAVHPSWVNGTVATAPSALFSVSGGRLAGVLKSRGALDQKHSSSTKQNPVAFTLFTVLVEPSCSPTATHGCDISVQVNAAALATKWLASARIASAQLRLHLIDSSAPTASVSTRTTGSVQQGVQLDVFRFELNRGVLPPVGAAPAAGLAASIEVHIPASCPWSCVGGQRICLFGRVIGLSCCRQPSPDKCAFSGRLF